MTGAIKQAPFCLAARDECIELLLNKAAAVHDTAENRWRISYMTRRTEGQPQHDRTDRAETKLTTLTRHS